MLRRNAIPEPFRTVRHIGEPKRFGSKWRIGFRFLKVNSGLSGNRFLETVFDPSFFSPTKFRVFRMGQQPGTVFERVTGKAIVPLNRHPLFPELIVIRALAKLRELRERPFNGNPPLLGVVLVNLPSRRNRMFRPPFPLMASGTETPLAGVRPAAAKLPLAFRRRNPAEVVAPVSILQPRQPRYLSIRRRARIRRNDRRRLRGR